VTGTPHANLQQILDELRQAVHSEMWRTTCVLAGTATEGLLRLALISAGVPAHQIATLSLGDLKSHAIRHGLLEDPFALISSGRVTSASAGSVFVALRNWGAHFSLTAPVFDVARAGRAIVLLISLSEHIFPTELPKSDAGTPQVPIDKTTDWSTVPVWQLRSMINAMRSWDEADQSFLEYGPLFMHQVVARGNLLDVVALADYVRKVVPTLEADLRDTLQSSSVRLIRLACHCQLRYLEDACRALIRLKLPSLAALIGWLVPLDRELLRCLQREYPWVRLIFYLRRCRISDYPYYQVCWRNWTRPDGKNRIWADRLAREFWNEWLKRPASLVTLGNFLRQIPWQARLSYLRNAPRAFLSTEIGRQDIATVVNFLVSLPEATSGDGLDELRNTLATALHTRLNSADIREVSVMPWRIHNVASSAKCDFVFLKRLVSLAVDLAPSRCEEGSQQVCRLLWDAYQVFEDLGPQILAAIDRLSVQVSSADTLVLARLAGIRRVIDPTHVDIPSPTPKELQNWLGSPELDRWAKMQIALGICASVRDQTIVNTCRDTLGNFLPDTRPETEASRRLCSLARESGGLDC